MKGKEAKRARPNKPIKMIKQQNSIGKFIWWLASHPTCSYFSLKIPITSQGTNQKTWCFFNIARSCPTALKSTQLLSLNAAQPQMYAWHLGMAKRLWNWLARAPGPGLGMGETINIYIYIYTHTCNYMYIYIHMYIYFIYTYIITCVCVYNLGRFLASFMVISWGVCRTI